MRIEHVDAALARIRLTANAHALLSADGFYRYWLHRTWFTGTGWTVFFMLNPSVADALRNDPTIRRCIGFAQAWGTRGVVVVNLYAARSTDPDELRDMFDPVGPENELFVRAACRLSSRVICGWGAHPMAGQRVKWALRIIKEMRADALCLGVAKSGAPLHPLYVPASKDPEPLHG